MSAPATQNCTSCGRPFAADMTYCPFCNANVPGVKQPGISSGTILVAFLIFGGLLSLVLKMAGVL